MNQKKRKEKAYQCFKYISKLFIMCCEVFLSHTWSEQVWLLGDKPWLQHWPSKMFRTLCTCRGHLMTTASLGPWCSASPRFQRNTIPSGSESYFTSTQIIASSNAMNARLKNSKSHLPFIDQFQYLPCSATTASCIICGPIYNRGHGWGFAVTSLYLQKLGPRRQETNFEKNLWKCLSGQELRFYFQEQVGSPTRSQITLKNG